MYRDFLLFKIFIYVFGCGSFPGSTGVFTARRGTLCCGLSSCPRLSGCSAGLVLAWRGESSLLHQESNSGPAWTVS